MKIESRAVCIALLAGIALVAATQAPAAPPEFCYELYQPVCGVAGKNVSTFPNACYAQRASATVLHQGACTGSGQATCPDNQSAPVCATSLNTHVTKTYASLCWAEKDLAVVVHNGHC